MLTNPRDAMLYWIGRCADELLRIFDFQNCGRPPSWIWYDVIADHPRLVFDGPNILLNCTLIVFIFCEISQFLYLARLALNCLFKPFFGGGGGLGDMTGFPLELGTGARGQKTKIIGLPDGRKSFKIGLAVLKQYWCITDRHPATQPASHVPVAKTALTYTLRGWK